MKKKILLIAASNMSLSGVPVVFMSIVRSLSDEFIFDIVIQDDKDMHFENEFLSYGGRIFKFSNLKPKNFFKKMKWFFCGYKKNAISFVKENININDYICIHTFNGEFGSIVFHLFRKNKNILKIFHVCSAQSVYKNNISLKQIIWNWNFKDVYKYADKVLYVSKEALKYAKVKEKSQVLYNIYDETKFNTIENCSHNNLALTQIGTFSTRKNQLFSLKLIKILKSSFPNVKLNIVGKEIEKGYLKKLLTFIDKESLQTNVEFFNEKTDRILINKNTSYIIYPSLQDSFGLVLIETQASGIHCFASNTIPQDADMGNVEFLPLTETIWTDKIKNYFLKNGNNRTKPTAIDTFSRETFVNNLLFLYNRKNEKSN